jgi:[NiFe] hydrogenase assembly HybE family chaperone
MEHLTRKLEAVFRRIEQERMRDIPVCNPALRVEAVGFRQWEEYYLGVMVTPWFMNLMLLPLHPESTVSAAEGSKQLHCFPSGRYEFIHGRETELGDYQVCSLFSPMYEFAEQQSAVDTAHQVLAALMDASHQEGLATPQEPATTPTPAREQEPAADRPMSRRDFLRGGRVRAREAAGGD